MSSEPRTPLFENLYGSVPRIWGIDLRALAAFRVGLGVLLLVDLVARSLHLVAHYTDAGVLPRAALAELQPGLQLSLHTLSGSAAWQIVLFLVAAVCALALLVGYRTRWAAVASWVLLLSLHIRNPYVINSGDRILLLMLLWSCLLPLGACRSLDARRVGSVAPAKPLFTLATAGVLLQLYAVYVVSVFYKTGASWRKNFTALYEALSLEAYTRPLGEALGDGPLWVLQMGTIATLALEFGGPLLALSPYRTNLMRTLAAFLFIGFHAALAVTMTLGLFPYICMVAWLIVLPGSFWDWFDARTRALGRVPAAMDRGVSGQRPWASLELRGVGTAAAVCLIWSSVLVGWKEVRPFSHSLAFGSSWEYIGAPFEKLRLIQRWGMFAPFPARIDAWYELVGVTTEGERISLRSGEPYRPLPGAEAARMYGSEYWRKLLFEHYRQEKFEPHRVHYAAYLWADWHRRHPERPLEAVEIVLYEEETPPPGKPSKVERTVLVRYRG